MTVVDSERVLVGLKAYFMTKKSFGQRDLLAKTAELEVRHAVPEGQEGFSDLPVRPHVVPSVSTPHAKATVG
jgi:hypothetical protein